MFHNPNIGIERLQAQLWGYPAASKHRHRVVRLGKGYWDPMKPIFEDGGRCCLKSPPALNHATGWLC